MMSDAIPPVTAVRPTLPTEYFNKIEYDTRVIKATVRIQNDVQQETVYTYDKYGQLENSVVHKKILAEV